jgi:hypothetical protein
MRWKKPSANIIPLGSRPNVLESLLPAENRSLKRLLSTEAV